MSLTRRLSLWLLLLLALALAGSLAVHTLQAQRALQAQLALRNADAAAALALALSQHGGEPAALHSVAAAQFDLGHYAQLSLTAPDGRVLLQLQAEPRPPAAPAWFSRLLPLRAPEGQARVSDGWREVGLLRLQAATAWATEALWQATLRTALLLAALGLAAWMLLALVLRRWQRPLQDVVAQAEALEAGRYLSTAEPASPELAQLTRAMNHLVARLQHVHAASAQQVAQLQQQAQQDPVTRLPRRDAFVGRLQETLAAGADENLPGCLLLVRVPGLQAVNHALGFEATDHLLAALADVLQTYVARVPGSFAGRLNGSDFALCLPAPGVAAETGATLLAALAASPVARSASVHFVIGAIDGLPGAGASAALAAADAALAAAEAGLSTVAMASHDALPAGVARLAPHDDAPPLPPHTQLVVHRAPDFVADPAGARAWRTQIADALTQGRVRLGAFAVRGPQGQLLHLECPLRVQLRPDEDFHPAQRWLALAARGRLLPQVDLTALDLALAATAADGQPRGVHVSAASLASAPDVAAITRRLQAAPEAAARLWLDLDEALLSAGPWPEATAATLAGWRRLGVRLVLEHAGTSPQALAALPMAGLDAVKVAARHLHGVAGDDAVRQYAGGLLALLHGLGLQVIAEGVDSAEDLAALWALGFDGATGPAVR
jgi:EAL domain-containing protein (putative c-di-GMP-specific phosphodiesterase class I)/GGDEF domain-containing protein